MDEIADKFKSLFGGKSSKFKGSGHRLGTAEEHGLPASKGPASGSRTARPSNAATQSTRPSALGAPSVGSSAASASRPAQQAQPTAAMMPGARPSAPSAMTTPAPAAPEFISAPVITAGGGLGYASMAPLRSSGSGGARPVYSPPVSPTRPPPTAAASVDDDALFALQTALATIVSQPECGGSLEILSRLLGNLLSAPHEAKFRTVKLGNPRIREAITQARAVAGGLELLEAAGFSVDVDTSSPTAAASFLDDARLPLAAEALAAVRSALAHQAPASATAAPPPAVSAPPASQPAAQLATASSCGAADEPSSLLAGVVMAGSGAQPEAASSTADSAAAARPTLVLIPAAPDTTVPDWFFDRTPADVKAEYASTVKRRQAGEVLMTRAMREAAARAASRGTQAARFATVRVRLPEGLLVQAEFAASEPLAAVHEWLAGCLLSPALSFELILPSRKLLPLTGVFRGSELMPAALLNFRLTGEGDAAAYQRRCVLRDDLMAAAVVE